MYLLYLLYFECTGTTIPLLAASINLQLYLFGHNGLPEVSIGESGF